MSGETTITYGGITFRKSDVKSCECIKYFRNPKEKDFIVTLNNGTKISALALSKEINRAGGAFVVINDDNSVTLHNLVYAKITGVDGQKDIFRICGENTMRNTFNLNNNSGLIDNDEIIIDDTKSIELFSKVNKINIKEGDCINWFIADDNLLSQKP